MDIYIPEMQFFAPVWVLLVLAYPIGFLIALPIIRWFMLLLPNRRKWESGDYMALTFCSLTWPTSLLLVVIVLLFLTVAYFVRLLFEPRE